MGGLLRSLFFINTHSRSRQAGFVLPTTVLLLLMVTLTTAAISFRSFSRTQAVIAQREQEVIVGAAAPAIDRAKAKIEYLFAQDIRFPGGLPTSNKLQAMMRNMENLEAGGSNNSPLPGSSANPEDDAPYTLPDETRLNLNNDPANQLDNAWSFVSDIDGDGVAAPNEVIVYSILMDDAQIPPGGAATDPPIDIDDVVSDQKAQALVNRNAPIDTATAGNACPVVGGAPPGGQRIANSQGWEALDNVNLLKNFQIDVFVINDNAVNRTVSTLEFQQVRQAQRGNKWGAWFKNDLEIFPGPAFTWNGAMHTEGSVFLGNAPNLNLISAYNSCLYPDPTASEITLASNQDGSFAGQLVVGRMGSATNNGFDVGAGDPSVDWNDGTVTSHGSIQLTTNNDSVQPQGTPQLSDIALDPIQIFTADISVHRNPATWTRFADWANSPLVTNARVFNDQNSQTPFLDDLYRADNRYGPKPSYTSNLRLSDANGGAGAKIGDPIPSAQAGLVDLNGGLDGYWERQAIREGLRIIGGERLELGNATIWKGAGTANPNEMDPLYPYSRSLSYRPNNALRTDLSTRLHRMTLRDNLAAVQSMAVYHARGADGGDFPLMCMSMTAHPGTQATINRSTGFNNISPGLLDIDFFNGFGTNGWEYGPPMGSEAAFTNAYNNSNSDLNKALTNLAHFAGDPLGGAPSFTPVQDEHIHPYPTMSMWGDFSHLRRLLDAGTSYADLSPADQSYLHTAACTLGMLADNIDKINNLTFSPASLNQIALAIGNSGIPDVGDQLVASTHVSFSNTFVLPTSPHAYISTLQAVSDNNPASTQARRIAQLARILHLQYQIRRDRTYGFENASRNAAAAALTTYVRPLPVQYGPHDITGSAGGATPQTIPNGTFVRLGVGIDPSYFGLAEPSDAVEEKKFLQLAALTGGIDISSTPVPPTRNTGNSQFPSLFYLFPLVPHDQIGAGAGSIPQPANELYIDDGVDTDGTVGSDLYIQDANNLFLYEAFSDADIASIALTPKTTGSWISPSISPLPANNSNTITVGGTDRATLFLDKGFMDGRELMSSRALDIDINLATTQLVVASDPTSTWIAPNTVGGAGPAATGGIVYAFREDARREDSIVRPIRTFSPASAPAAQTTDAQAAWTTCRADITNVNCIMQFDFGPANDPYSSVFDPPLRREVGNNDTYISPKPVDYFADPMRRPYGFRLSNGSTLNRTPVVTAGLSFISDNAVAIKGDFNLHNSTTGVPREEFDELLSIQNNGAVDEDDFYENRTNRSLLFANPAPGAGGTPGVSADTWRPVEVVGDAVTILSDNFNDGSVDDALMLPRATTVASGTSSYQNYLRPRGQGSGDADGDYRTLPVSIKNPSLFRENPYDGYDPNFNPTGSFTGDSLSSPIKVWRDGGFKGERTSINGDLMNIGDGNLNGLRRNDLILPASTTVNALIVTGVVPSRAGQSNGGLHNLPRFLEFWNLPNTFMRFFGGFFQLNYSTASTGPWDDKNNGWEPTAAAPAGGESITFYGAPRRVWGYDVALQFAPPGPVSTRFITIGNPRSEYYQEVAADDPYMKNLQCAKNRAGSFAIENRTVTCS